MSDIIYTHERLLAVEAAIIAVVEQLAQQNLVDPGKVAQTMKHIVGSSGWMSDHGFAAACNLANHVRAIQAGGAVPPVNSPDAPHKKPTLTLVERQDG